MNRFWEIKNEADSDSAELLLYGEITSDANLWRNIIPDDPSASADTFARDLKALDGKELTLRINSPGGDVFQAQAMYSLLKAYKGKVKCYIDGICASAATLVACAADSITMPDNAIFMIHNPAVGVCDWLQPDDVVKLQNSLQASVTTSVNVYKAKTGLEEAKIKELMDAESWLTAQEAKEYGFVDEIDGYEVAACVGKDGILSINGLEMPGLKAHQDSILAQMKPKKGEPMNVLDQIRALLEGENKPAEPTAEQKAQAEAARIAALDGMKGDNDYVNALVETAKAQGMSAEALKPFADAVANVEPKMLQQIKALILDQQQSGAAQVKPEPVANKPVNAVDDEIAKVAALANKKRG